MDIVGDETSVEISHIKDDCKELRADYKEMAKDLAMMKIDNVEMKSMFRSIKESVSTARNAIIGFVVFSVLTYFVAMYARYGGINP